VSAARRPPAIDPVGTWSCVIYGHPDFGDERVLLHFAPNGALRLARFENGKPKPWIGLVGWISDDDELRFVDPQTGRQFNADLRRTTLGGGWRTLTLIGGWWCSPMNASEAPQEVDNRALPQALIPTLTATPRYPVQAIRAAKQGRAVMCYFVSAAGVIVEPEVIELSDEIFRAPILAALERSRYQGWRDDGTLRPACRSYTFRLDSLIDSIDTGD
jgi:hypothetical protein